MAQPDGGLITETNRQYYEGAQSFKVAAGVLSYTTTFNTDLIYGNYLPTNPDFGLNNFVLYTSLTGLPGSFVEYISEYSVFNNIITFAAALATNSFIVVQLKTETGGEYGNQDAFGKTTQENHGGYQYVSINDIINNFMIAYVGAGKLITSIKRTDVLFHAKRGLQEFSYDTLKSIHSSEMTVPPSLSVPLPQDYVNYVSCSWVDRLGVKHPIYPTTLTTRPYSTPLQDNLGIPTSGAYDQTLEGSSQTNERWDKANPRLLSGGITNNDINNGLAPLDIWNFDWGYGGFYGQRYGLDPEISQVNGWFNIDEREGKMSFSSDINGALIILEYISDGVSYDVDMKVPKLAEDALYAHISHAVLASRINIPEYIINRLRRERSAKLRNAKIRLSNIKLEEFTQVMTNKSKWIKH
tara:strand:- start:5645 stop:6877 length:1233 start_codon:yes stop_codon:yes gene_type:complete